MRFGSPIATPSQQFTPGQTDLLFQGSSSSSGGAGQLQQFVTAKNSYTAIAIQNAGAIPNCVAVEVQNNTSLLGWSSGQPKQPNAANVVILPFACNAGDQILISEYVNAASAGAIILVWGLTGTPPPTFYRADGRAFCFGMFGSGLFNQTTSGNLINAPGAGLRLFIKQLYFFTSGEAELTNLTGGGGYNPISGNPPPLGVIPIPDDGWLLDINTNLAIQQIGTSQILASATYDIVPG